LVLDIFKEKKRNSNFSFLKLKVKVLTTGEILECYILEDFLFNNNPQLTPEESKFMMIDFDNRMRENNIKRNSSQYKIALQNDIYLNALKCKFGHAITIHKSQGSEWDYVFIPLTSKDFALKERSSELVLNIAKLMYTAITRARTKVFLTDGFWIKGFNIRHPKFIE
jgi:superfamily I DNA/RNA helicase